MSGTGSWSTRPNSDSVCQEHVGRQNGSSSRETTVVLTISDRLADPAEWLTALFVVAVAATLLNAIQLLETRWAPVRPTGTRTFRSALCDVGVNTGPMSAMPMGLAEVEAVGG